MLRGINWWWLVLSLVLWLVISRIVSVLLVLAFPGLPSIVAYVAVLVVTFVIVNYIMQRNAGRISGMRLPRFRRTSRRVRRARNRSARFGRSVTARVETQRLKMTTDMDAELRKLLDEQGR